MRRPLENIYSYFDVKNVVNSRFINKWQVYWQNLNTKLIESNINPWKIPGSPEKKKQ